VLTLEFTIEPFVAGHPGPHVLRAVAAAEALGVTVEFGPFGSSCSVTPERAGEVARAILDAAVAHGATHVSLHVSALAATRETGEP
jgi:hypothetical protein